MPRRRQWAIFAGVILVSCCAPVMAFLILQTPLGSFYLLVAAVLLLVMFLSAILVCLIVFRPRAQRTVYQDILNAVSQTRESKHTDIRMLRDLPPSHVQHVFASTELRSAQPLFFSRSWIYTPTFGWGEPAVLLGAAVYASAAFPAVFPPYRLSTECLNLAGGDPLTPVPNKLLVADGGIYNNLATDWFDTAHRLLGTPWRMDDRFPLPEAQPDHIIVVNASAPSRIRQIPRRWPRRNIYAFARIMTVLSENTVRPRLAELKLKPIDSLSVIDIAASPVDIASDVVSRSPADSPTFDRASALVAAFNNETDHYWLSLVDESSLLKTTLAPVGTVRAAQLLRQGYLSAIAALHPRFNSAGLATLPGESSFREMVMTGQLPWNG